MEIKDMNIWKRVNNIRKLMCVIRKTKSGFNYKYVPEEDILAILNNGLNKYNVSLTSTILEDKTNIELKSYIKDKKLKDGTFMEERVNEYVVTGVIKYTWTNLDNESDKIDVSWVFAGQGADVSQAFGSALTYANRYFLLKFFQVATPENDPDLWIDKSKKSQNKYDMADLKSIQDSITATISSCEDEKIKSEIVAEFMKHITVNGEPSKNYKTVTDIDLAIKLLNIAKEKCKSK